MTGIWNRYKRTIITLVVLILLAVIFYDLHASRPHTLSMEAGEILSTIRSTEQEGGTEEHVRAAIISTIELMEDRELLSDLYKHAAIAFVVAFIVIVAVEIYSAEQTRREIAEYRDSVANAVWKAISGREVPETVTQELEAVLKTEVIRRDSRYTLIFSSPCEGMDTDTLILKRRMISDYVNITSNAVDYPFKATIVSAFQRREVTLPDGTPCKLPRHCFLSVDEKEEPLSEGENGNIKIEEDGHRIRLAHTVHLSSGKSKTICVESDEVMSLEDSNTYTQMIPLDGLTVRVENKYQERIKVLNVILHHPNWTEFKPDAEGAYRFKGGLLAGQGFGVTWKRAP